MHYRAPPLPVDLRFLQNNGTFGVVDPYSLNNLANTNVTGTTGDFVRPTDGTPLPMRLQRATRNTTLAPATATGMHTDVPRSYPAPMEQEHPEIDREAHMKQFRHIAMNKHNIRLN